MENGHAPAVTVSVIIPVFNAEQWVARALDSVLHQTQDGVEVVVVDDGSTDDTAAVVHDYLQNAAQGDRGRVTVIRRPENGGYVRALRDGLRASHGQWTWCHDADDTAEPELLRRLWRAAERAEAQMAVCRMMYVDEQGTRLGPVPQWVPWFGVSDGAGALLELARGRFNGYLANKLIRRSLWDSVGRWPDSVYADFELTMQLLSVCRSIAHIDRELYHYTVRAGSVTSGLSTGLWDLRLLPVGYADALSRAGVSRRRARSAVRLFRHRQVYWPILHKTAQSRSSELGEALYSWVRSHVALRELLALSVRGVPSAVVAATVGWAVLAPRSHARALRRWKAARA